MMDTRVRYGFLLALFVFAAGILAVGAVGAGTDASENITKTEEEIDIETDRVSINLQSQRTVIEADESLILTHSATNYITNEDPLTIQLILEAPSGSDVSGTGDIGQGTGSQFTTTTELEPGEQDSQRITIDLHEPGEYELTGEAVYFFGNDPDTGEGVEISLPVEQRPPPPTTTERITGVATLLPDAYHTLATDLENRAIASQGDEIIGIYAMAVVAVSLVLVLTLAPVIRLLTGRNIARDLRYRQMPQFAESSIGMFLFLAGMSLFILDTTAVAGGVGAERVWSAHVLAALLIATAISIVVSLVVLTKVHLLGKVLDVQLGIVDRLFDR